MLRFLVAAAALALGGCYLSHELSEPASCPSGTPPTCRAWMPAPPAVLVSDPIGLMDGVEIGSAIATDCGVVVAWSRATYDSSPYPTSYLTRTLDWSARPTAAPVTHDALAISTTSSTTFVLARGTTGLAAVTVSDVAGCRFVALGADGTPRGAPVTLETHSCLDLHAHGDGFSMLGTTDTGATPGELLALDASGALVSRTTLDLDAGRALWSRTFLADGTFIVYSFHEDGATGVYRGWLRHFDADGHGLAPEVEVGVNGVPVLVAGTSSGAVTAWDTATPGGLPLQLRATDADARPTGPTIDVPALDSQYGATLVSTPDGGALFAWLELGAGSPSAWRLQALALGPDATARGAPSLLLSGTQAAPIVVVAPSGDRALAVYSDRGIRALPLVCAP